MEKEQKPGRIENLDKFKTIFWDSPVGQLDIDQYRFYVIERILEYGDTEEVKWMFSRYSKDRIIEVLNWSRSMSKKSSQFWKEVLLGE